MSDIILVEHSTYIPKFESLYTFPGNSMELKAQKSNLCEYTLMFAHLSSPEGFEWMSAELPHPKMWAKLFLYVSASLFGSSGRQTGQMNCNENGCYSIAQQVSKLLQVQFSNQGMFPEAKFLIRWPGHIQLIYSLSILVNMNIWRNS